VGFYWYSFVSGESQGLLKSFIEHSDDEVKENRDKAEVIEISSDEDDL
jgi:hypothetical protein